MAVANAWKDVLLVYPVSWAVGAVLMVLYAWKGKWMQLPEAIS